MHRISKKINSKCGFSLTEVIIVVGIIIIIASVVGVGIADLLKNAKKSDEAIADSSNQLKQQINDSEAKLEGYNFG